MNYTDGMGNTKSHSIMIVDDDITSCRIVEHYLKSGGFEVEVFESSSSAIDSLEGKNYSLIISDWFMPELNGEAFLKRLKLTAAHIPVIFLTSNTDIENAVNMIRAGADDYLLKPVSQHELLFRVNRALDKMQNELMISQIKKEKDLLELENKQLVNWRLMYATKESEQVRQIISLMARTINQSGGFMWLDLLQASAQFKSDVVEIPKDIHDIILNAAGQQRRLIDLLVFINSIQTAPVNLAPIGVSSLVSDIVKPVIENSKNLSGKFDKQIQYVYADFTSSTGRIKVDSQFFQRIIHELIINAIKFSPDHAKISVEIMAEERSQGRTVGIHVRNPVSKTQIKNKSVGIPYEVSEQIFELFYTLNPYPEYLEGEEWTDGTGLYIARRLLQRMGAWIEVKNGLDYMFTPPEPFVQFIILLPITKE